MRRRCVDGVNYCYYESNVSYILKLRLNILHFVRAIIAGL